MGQRFPDTPITGDIQNRIQQFTRSMLGFRSARIAALGEQPFKVFPLGIV
jgi:hypothetical protein